MNQTEIKKILSDAIDGSTELATIRSAIESGCKAYNEAAENGNVKARAEITVKLNEHTADYAAKVQSLVFNTLAAKSDNLLPAILAWEYPVCTYKDEKQDMEIPGGTITVTVRKVDFRMKRIDLQKLDRYCLKNYEHRLSHDDTCWSMIDELNYFLVKRNANELGAVMESPYGFARTTTRGHLSADDFKSNTKTLKALQRVIDAVLYVPDESGKANTYKALSHDVRYLDICAASKSKTRLEVKAAKIADMTDTIGNVIFRIASGTAYTVAYKAAKSK